MSDIKVGDMVMIVRGRPCCGRVSPMHGIPWLVEEIQDIPKGVCGYCYRELPSTFYGGSKPNHFAPRSMLLKIDPPPREDDPPAPAVEVPEEATS